MVSRRFQNDIRVGGGVGGADEADAGRDALFEGDMFFVGEFDAVGVEEFFGGGDGFGGVVGFEFLRAEGGAD